MIYTSLRVVAEAKIVPAVIREISVAIFRISSQTLPQNALAVLARNVQQLIPTHEPSKTLSE